jgi:hypothetical protein
MKFWLRIVWFLFILGVTTVQPESIDVLEGMNFFRHFSVLHILWAFWMWYMIEKLLPLKNYKPRGCRKYRRSEFRPTQEYQRWKSDRQEEPSTVQEFANTYNMQKRWYNRGAGIVALCWLLVAVILWLLQHWCILSNQMLLLLSCLFYIGDMVCILFWCPFRDVLMKNRCCTQCRIYNWDTLMLILPIVFVKGFYSYSLLAGACLVVGIWELTHLLYPERFYPVSNATLQCENCRGELGCIRLQHKKEEK